MPRSHSITSDEGATSIYFAVIAAAALLATGLVVDGGRKMNALAEAIHIADNAARACAQHLDQSRARMGSSVLDPANAVAAGNAYLGSTGHNGQVVVSASEPSRCDVTVRVQVNTILLPGPLFVQATQSANGLDERG